MPRGLGGKHPHLTIVSLPSRATILSCHAHRLLALFDKARLIEHEHARGVAHLGCDEAMVRLAHQVFIPDIIAHAALHPPRSEEHTSELQSRRDLVCRLLLEK